MSESTIGTRNREVLVGSKSTWKTIISLSLFSIAQIVVAEAELQNKQISAQGTSQNALHMAALGDSITRAFNANGPIDHPWNSWATGNSDENGLFQRGQVKSHAEFLSETTGRDVIVHNVAKSGATSSDLARQVQSLKGVKLDYATILIGANDLCAHGQPTTPDGHADMTEYAGRVESGITQLIAENPQIKILLVSIPDLLRLQRIGHGTSCQSRWNTFGICKMLLGANVTEDSIAQFGTQLRTANEDLHLIAAKHSASVQFSTILSEYPYERDQLSDVDCFHPNIAGQNIISRETWNTGWWKD
jgi:lysophospholipase L1-like esterase